MGNFEDQLLDLAEIYDKLFIVACDELDCKETGMISYMRKYLDAYDKKKELENKMKEFSYKLTMEMEESEDNT